MERSVGLGCELCVKLWARSCTASASLCKIGVSEDGRVLIWRAVIGIWGLSVWKTVVNSIALSVRRIDKRTVSKSAIKDEVSNQHAMRSSVQVQRGKHF